MPSTPWRIAITQGDPGGCGPDLCVEIAHSLNQQQHDIQLVWIGDSDVLAARAEQLGKPLHLTDFDPARAAVAGPGECAALHLPLSAPARIGQSDSQCQPQVLEALALAVQGCLRGDFDALVTGPVQKAQVQRVAADFRGQTEQIAALCAAAGQPGDPLMTFVADDLRLALATTHLPLAEVPAAITQDLLLRCLRTLRAGLKQHFALPDPRLLVLGLNPHAGEQGLLGSEEIEVIEPAVRAACREGMQVTGPVPADTAFTPAVLARADAVLCMYHDQGLTVVKNRSFERAVNLTLGLPVLRTSPDHGTALDLAGSGEVNAGSALHAVQLAAQLLARGGGR